MQISLYLSIRILTKMSRNSQKSYSKHFRETEALRLQWDESFREHNFTPLVNKDSCPKIYTCQGRKTLPMSAKQIFQTQFFTFTRSVIKMMGNPASFSHFSFTEGNVLEICCLQCCYTLLCDTNRTCTDDKLCSNKTTY